MTHKNETNDLELLADKSLVLQAIANLTAMTDEAFEKLLSSTGKSVEKDRANIQILALDSLLKAMPKLVEVTHAQTGEKETIDQGSNYDRANRVMAMVTVSMSKRNANQLQLWFMKHGSFRWVKTEDKNFIPLTGGYKFKKDTSEKAKPFNLEQAYVTKWYMVEGFTKSEINQIVKLTADSGMEGLERTIKSYQTKLDKGVFETDKDREFYQGTVNTLKSAVKGLEKYYDTLFNTEKTVESETAQAA